MSRKTRFKSSIINIISNNRDGSYRTQNDRQEALLNMAEEIYKRGYQLDHARYIERRHIEYLTTAWKSSGTVGAGSMKNRLSHMRWLMGKLNKKSMVPSNDELGIPKRVYVTNKDKSTNLKDADLEKIKDPLMQLSLRGQALFGLRMEESLKIQPFVADCKDYLYLKKSWCKGGRERLVPIRTEEQRQWLEECKTAVKQKSNSLIPANAKYITYRHRFERRCERSGINKRHGLRHQYAQKRYKEITGFECTVKNGPSKKEMTPEQKQLDLAARLQVSIDLGHSRRNIGSIYLGVGR